MRQDIARNAYNAHNAHDPKSQVRRPLPQAQGSRRTPRDASSGTGRRRVSEAHEPQRRMPIVRCRPKHHGVDPWSPRRATGPASATTSWRSLSFSGGGDLAQAFGQPRRESRPFTDQRPAGRSHLRHFDRSALVWRLYHQQTKNLLVSYSPKKLGFFQGHKRRRLNWAYARQAPSSWFIDGASLRGDEPVPGAGRRSRPAPAFSPRPECPSPSDDGCGRHCRRNRSPPGPRRRPGRWR